MADAPPPDAAARINGLRAQGAHRLDPVRFHYLETLAGRLEALDAAVRRVLEARLENALATYATDFEQAKADAHAAMAQLSADHPETAAELQEKFDAGDFRGLREAAAKRKENPPPDSSAAPSSLAELTRYLAAQFPEHGAGSLDERFGSPVELKTIRRFRDTWTRLSVEKQLSRAIEQGPANAGPLNSHRLVLRALGLMRDLSPAYLGRFMSYVDALLWLDQGDGDPKPVQKSAAENDKPRKAGRTRAR